MKLKKVQSLASRGNAEAHYDAPVHIEGEEEWNFPGLGLPGQVTDTAKAQTGTGKTAAFALPLLQKLAQSPRKTRKGTPRALILAPTRELALQIHKDAVLLGVQDHLELWDAAREAYYAQAAVPAALRLPVPGRLPRACGGRAHPPSKKRISA